MRQAVDMGQGKVSHVLGRLALPLMVSLFFQNLYAYADTVFVSWLGETPLAAISLALPLTYLALSLAKGVAMGSVILMSFSRGAGDEAAAHKIAESLFPLMLLFMALFSPLMLAPAGQAFYLAIGADPATAAQGTGFIFWLAASFFPMGHVMTVEALFTARGDTVTPMKAMLLGNILNIGLDPLFIFVFGWGVAGAAAATFVGQSISAVYIGYRLKQMLGMSLQWLPKPRSLRVWWQILKQGLFVTAAYLITPIALMLLNGILVRFGAVAVGAWNLMSRTEMMVMLPIMGLSNALATFTGFNLGRLDYDRVRQGVFFFLKVSWAVIIPASLLFFFLPQQTIGLFRPTPELKLLGGIAMQASALSILFMPLLSAVAGMSQGMKRPVYMMGLMFVYLVCLRVPLADWFADRWGQQGVYWSHPVASVCTAALALFLLRRLLLDCRKLVMTGTAATAKSDHEGA